ncbi:DUF4388 domain-containing protein [Thermosulfurimonas marina]|uniref:DUF4388 domain-containing protein n=1 Tax=Thermosulfurimonas marina TaxID=2047767 RepID=A0A6H1WU55_9BACT|nr:response regulator [Thermosulfurimonas marina]QJA06718.1 DUF4388 domain-containing protein [Thermosulfurimonas marina]
MSQHLKGRLETLGVEALLQALGLSGQTGVLRVVGPQGEGQISLYQGRIVEARAPQGEGKEAVFELLSWKEGEMEFSPQPVDPGPSEYTVEALLMEAATYHSEKGREGALSVLLVEDSPLAARTLAEIIETSPDLHLLEVLSNGEEALWAAAEYHPDVILLDLHLPGLSGSKAFKYLMVKSPAPVVLTSSTLGEEALSLLALGAAAFCLKGPGQREHLASLLKEASRVKVERLRRYLWKERPLERASQERPSRLTVILSGLGGMGEVLEYLSHRPFLAEEALIWVLDGCPEALEGLARVLQGRVPWPVHFPRATTILLAGGLYLSRPFPALRRGPVLDPVEASPEALWSADLPLEVEVFSGTRRLELEEVPSFRVKIRDPRTAPAPDLPASFEALESVESFKDARG